MEDKNQKRVGKVGGQAVLEGIMMRGPESYTTAVRKSDGTIIRDSHPNEIKKKAAPLRLPIIRGVVSFVDSLILSFSTLNFAADALEIEEETKFEKWLTRTFGKSLTGIVMGVASVLGILFALLLFFILPAFLSSFIPNQIARKAAESVLRIVIFLAYICLVSLMNDIKRTFMYHGAEHKSIFCYEKGLELTVENVRAQKRFHPRCGTSFMVLMMIIGFFIGMLIGVVVPATDENQFLYVAIKLLLLPLTMGLGYEVIRFAGKHDNAVVRFFTAPGLWIQRLTTKEPTDDMIEVAIVALKSALPQEFSEEEVFKGISVPEPFEKETESPAQAEQTASSEKTDFAKDAETEVCAEDTPSAAEEAPVEEKGEPLPENGEEV